MKPGAILQDRYRVIKSLGRGGSGTVYLCLDARLAGKQWAVKEMVCRDPSLIARARERFEGEAKLLARLRHRNLPLIVDYFWDSQSQFLVMEYIEGPTLGSLIETEGPASEHQALRWALELARVLDYLHRQDPPIIFRDLKPTNIMVTDERHLKLIDFGLARHFDTSAPKRDSAPTGSVGYTSPEQWENRVDERSDIYSLGATIYYVLSGKPPSPVYGSHRLKPGRPDLDQRTEDLVLRCMHPEPGQRYSGAGELIRDLLLLLSEPDVVSSRAPGPDSAGEVVPERYPAPRRSAPPLRLVPARRTPVAPLWLPFLLLLASVIFGLGALLGLFSERLRTAAPITAEVQAKEHARALIARGDANSLREAAAILDTMVTRHPADAEAHILKQNAYALLLRPDAEQGIVRVPALVPLHGVDAPEGAALLYGLAQAQSAVNLSGGVARRQVVIDLYDDRSEVNRTLSDVQAIVKDPRYLVCFGPFSSQRTMAAAPLFNQAGLAVLAATASDPRVWESGPFIFTASDSNFPRLKALARHFLAQGHRRGAILISEDYLLSASMSRYFEDELIAGGGEVVAPLTYRDATLDFSPQVAQIRSSGADFVFVSEYRSGPVLRLARQMGKEGVNLPIGAQVIPFTPDLAEQGGEAVEGLLLSGYFHPDLDRPEVRDYTADFRQMFGGTRQPTHVDAGGFDTAEVLFRALEEALKAKVSGDAEAQLRERRKVARDYLASIGDERPPFRGVTGSFALARRMDLREVFLIQLHQGRYELVQPSLSPDAH